MAQRLRLGGDQDTYIDIYAALDDNKRSECQRDYPDEAQTIAINRSRN